MDYMHYNNKTKKINNKKTQNYNLIFCLYLLSTVLAKISILTFLTFLGSLFTLPASLCLSYLQSSSSHDFFL